MICQSKCASFVDVESSTVLSSHRFVRHGKALTVFILMSSFKLHIGINTIKNKHTYLLFRSLSLSFCSRYANSHLKSPGAWRWTSQSLKPLVKLWVKDAPQYFTAAQSNHAGMTAFFFFTAYVFSNPHLAYSSRATCHCLLFAPSSS